MALDQRISQLRPIMRRRNRWDAALAPRLILLVCAGALISVGVFITPLVAFLPLALVGGLLLLMHGRFRVLFVVLGGSLALQSSAELDLVKMSYLLGCGIALFGSLAALRRKTGTAMRPRFFFVSLLLFTMCAVSLPVSLAHGTSVVVWLRDAAPYLLLASVPVFAMDAHLNFSNRQLLILLVATGLLAAASFSVTWLGASRRNLAQLPLNKLVLPSFLLPAALFSEATGRVFAGRVKAFRWMGLAVLTAGLLLVTGTRSTVALAAAPVAQLLAARDALKTRIPRAIGFGLAFGCLILMTVVGVAYLTNADTSRVTTRLESVPGVVGDPTSDYSYRDRASQADIAWRAFASEPMFGVGPGKVFSWSDASGVAHSTFALDTGMSLLAKFGLIGTLALLTACLILVIDCLKLSRRPAAMQGQPVAGLFGYLAIGIVWLALGSPFEDKGFELALLLLLGLALHSRIGTTGIESVPRQQ